MQCTKIMAVMEPSIRSRLTTISRLHNLIWIGWELEENLVVFDAPFWRLLTLRAVHIILFFFRVSFGVVNISDWLAKTQMPIVLARSPRVSQNVGLHQSRLTSTSVKFSRVCACPWSEDAVDLTMSRPHTVTAPRCLHVYINYLHFSIATTPTSHWSIAETRSADEPSCL